MTQSESTRRLLASVESFKRAKEADEIRRWRHATAAERWAAIAHLMDWAEETVRRSGRPYVPDPLPTNWLPRRRQ